MKECVYQVDKLRIEISETRRRMGDKVGADIESAIEEILKEKEEVRVVFAAAPSQNEVLAYLRASKRVEWERVTAFHMDEYLNLAPNATQGFARFLNNALFDRVPFKSVHRMAFDEENLDKGLLDYAALLTEKPIDIICLGVGENGHIAFNDPTVADFNDPLVIKRVELEEKCRLQQVHDGCFERLELVPTHAVTLTIPALMSGGQLFCAVPGKTKAGAINAMLTGGITTQCPASILRTHPHGRLYTDFESMSLVNIQYV